MAYYHTQKILISTFTFLYFLPYIPILIIGFKCFKETFFILHYAYKKFKVFPDHLSKRRKEFDRIWSKSKNAYYSEERNRLQVELSRIGMRLDSISGKSRKLSYKKLFLGSLCYKTNMSKRCHDMHKLKFFIHLIISNFLNFLNISWKEYLNLKQSYAVFFDFASLKR